MDRDLYLGAGVMIPSNVLEWRFTASGGPGGQHANRSNTRAEVVVDLDDLTMVDPEVVARLRRKLGSVVAVAVDDTRSQRRNRQLALDRLQERLRDALVVRPKRRPTRPTAGSRRRRLTAKRQRGQLKRNRRPPSAED